MNFVSEAYAQITNPALPFAGSGAGEVIIGNLISAIVSILLTSGFILALFHLMFGALRWVTASGEKAALQSAQDRMTQAVVGLILLVASWAIMMLVSTILGFDFPNFNFQSISGAGGGGGGTTRNYGDTSPGPELGSMYVWTRSGSYCTYAGNRFTYDYDYWCRTK